MPEYIDMVGEKYGYLTVVKYHHSGNKTIYWECLCDCGKTAIVSRTNLIRKFGTKSCGCKKYAKETKGMKDETGNKYGNLAVISYSHSKDKKVFWRCVCDCGNEKIVSGRSLRNGSTKSCGCYRRKLNTETKGKGFGVSALNSVFKSYKEGASKRNLEFNLSLEQFRNLVIGDCFYCGSAPMNERKLQHYSNQTFRYNGIDRLDNDKGYVFSNVVSCCRICNKAKLNLTVKEFIVHIEKIYMFQTRRLTQPAPDVWDSAPLKLLSTPEVDSDLGNVPTPATRR